MPKNLSPPSTRQPQHVDIFSFYRHIPNRVAASDTSRHGVTILPF
jgi:hypothetical protein